MLDFRPHVRPRTLLTGSQRRGLLAIILGAAAVGILARWLIGHPTSGPENPPSVVPPATSPLSPPPLKATTRQHSTAATGRLANLDPSLFAAVRDDRPSRTEEAAAWYELLRVLKTTPQPVLASASLGRVTRLQLMEQADFYRGRLVTISGTVRRAEHLPVPKNAADVTAYEQLWLEVPDAPASPVVVYCLDLPPRLSTSDLVGKEVEFTAFFFKRWAYPAQDVWRTAPLLAAKTAVVLVIPGPQAPAGGSFQSAIVGGLAVAAVLAWLLVYVFRRPRGRLTAAAIALLAWPTAEAREQPSIQATSSSLRQTLAQTGFGPKEWAQFADGQELAPGEMPLVLKLLLRVQQFGPDLLSGEARPLPATPTGKTPSLEQGGVYQVEGTLRAAESRTPPPSDAKRFDVARYWHCLVDSDRGPIVVVADQVPSAWLKTTPLHDRVSAVGIYIKRGDLKGREKPPIVVAARVAWHPPTPLGKLGVDVGLLDTVQDDRLLSGAEKEAFYSILAAVNRAPPRPLWAEARQQLAGSGRDTSSVVPLFNAAPAERGHLVLVQGTARNAIQVHVDDPELIRRFGIRDYYQIGLFTDDSQGNPLIVCTAGLPPGMPTGDGPEYAESLRVAGFFLKKWAYRRGSLPGSDPEESGKLQLAPLILAAEPVWLPQPVTMRNSGLQWLAGGLFAAVVLTAWLWIWWEGRTRHRRPVIPEAEPNPLDHKGAIP